MTITEVTITEWRRRRYNAMQLMLRTMGKWEALVKVDEIWPLDDDVVCDCGRRPPAQNKRGHSLDNPMVWFNDHGATCVKVQKARVA